MSVFSRLAAAGLVLLGAGIASMAAPGCSEGPPSTVPTACPNGGTCQVRFTILHTSDIHSRLLPYDLLLTQVDANLGLGQTGDVKNVGGVARVSYVLQRERARSDRVLHLDSGDCFEGAPIFNFFNGEPEVRAQSMMGTDAMVIGNHEFDHGALNAARQFQAWANFPFLAANYKLETVNQASNSQLSNVLAPFTLFNVNGLKVAVIGMANISSLSSIFDQPNSSNITALNTVETAQFYVDLLRPSVDVIVMLSHLGLLPDEDMVRNTTGIDVVMGGHNHIVIDPPESLQDCSADPENPGYVWVVDPNLEYDPGTPPPNDAKHPDPTYHPFMMHRACKPREVLIQHSGAFAKYVGRLDLVFSNDPKDATPTGNASDYDPINGFEVISNKYTAFPIDDTIPEDPVMVDMLQPYIRGLNRAVDLNILVGFAPQAVQRFAPQGGDSPLGNLVSKSMWLRLGVQTDFAMTNSTGIRTDLAPGPVNVEEMFNIFPFDNTITKMQLSGLEVYDMFDFIARRSSGRGCQSQAQIAGARVRLNCAGCNRPNAAPTCIADSDCISAGANGCDQSTGHCIITACADEVYIGYTSQSCSTDADCPNQTPGSCDISLPPPQRKCLQPIENTNLYELATNNYLAQGGSGFRTLQRNTTQLDTKIAQRDALIDYIRQGHPCGYDPKFIGNDPAHGTDPDGLKPCTVDNDCADQGDFVCQCVGNSTESGSGTTATCPTTAACDVQAGRCVLRACRDGVAGFHDRLCADSTDPTQCESDLNSCELAGEECKQLTCVDANLGATTDNRVEMIGR